MAPVHYRSVFLLGVLTAILPVPCFSLDAETESSEEESGISREKRSIFPFVVGETILDIQCRRGALTVCAPDGPDACPVDYLSTTNVGVCGFATLNHFLNTTNIAGTCCYKTPGSSSSATTTTTTGRSVLLPQIVAYPVYAQYPYSIGSSGGSAATSSPSSSYSSPAASSYSSPSSSYSSSSPVASSYSSPSSSYSSSSPAASSSSYGSASPAASYGPSSSSPAAYARQYSSGSSSSYSSPASSYSSPASSSSSGQLVYNPQSLSYPPLLSLTNIPVPNGSLFNPFPPAYNVAAYGSSTALINALQTLLAQLLGTSGVSAATITALQNTLVLAMNTPGWSAQLVSSVNSAIALAQATSGLNAATTATMTAILALAATGTGNTVGNSVSSSSLSSSSSSSSSVCSNTAVSVPSLAPQFRSYLNSLKTQSGISSAVLAPLESFIESYAIAPIINGNAVTTLTPLLASIAATSGLSTSLAQSTANLQAGLAAYSTYVANGNTVALLQTLYQLSSTNRNLDPNVFGGLGALVAQTAGLSAVPVGTPPTLLVAIREATRYVAQSFQTPLSQLILAKIINCRVTPACCGGSSSSSSVAATTAASSSYAASSYGSSSGSSYSSPASSSSYGSPASSSSYSSPSSSSSSYSSPSSSSSYSSPSSSSSSYSPSSSSSYSASPAAASSYGSSSPSQVNNAAILGVNQSAAVYSAANYSTNSFPAFLPVYPVLQPASSSGTSSGYGSSSSSSNSGSVSVAIPASNISAYNYGYPTGLPQYPVLPYYTQAAASPASSSNSYASPSSSSAGYGSSSSSSPAMSSSYASPAVSSYGSSSSSPAMSSSYASPAVSSYGSSVTSAPVVSSAPAAYASASSPSQGAYGGSSGYAASPAVASPAASYGSSPVSAYGSSPVSSYSQPATAAPATAAPATSAPAYGGSSYGSSPVSSYSQPATAAPATAAPATSAPAYGGSSYGSSPVSSYSQPATAAPATAAPATSAPAYGGSSYGSSPVSSYSQPATAAPATAAPATSAPAYGGSSYGSSAVAAPAVASAPAAAAPAAAYIGYGSAPATAAPVPVTAAPVTAAPVVVTTAAPAATTAYNGAATAAASTVGSRQAMSTWGPFPMNDSGVVAPAVKALDQCGIPHANQQGDIAFLIANGQKGPRANIYRSKRAASSGREGRITNSMVAKEMEVCWMAAILLDGKYQSGASIVSEWFVLTAAHEIDGREISRLRIRVGDTDVRQGSLDKDERVGCIQDLAVEKIILHPDFDRKTLSSDIGLLKLKEPINLNSPCVCKICLQEEGPQEGETCIISGYGSTRVVDPSKTKTEEDAFALSGPNAEILRYAGIPVVANDVCAAAFKNDKLAPRLKVPFGVLDDTQVCAGGISQRDACYGDGGSPLVCFNGRSFYQSGVVSYGRGCGKALMAAVYGSVTAAAPWISEELATQSN